MVKITFILIVLTSCVSVGKAINCYECNVLLEETESPCITGDLNDDESLTDCKSAWGPTYVKDVALHDMCVNFRTDRYFSRSCANFFLVETTVCNYIKERRDGTGYCTTCTEDSCNKYKIEFF